jgi:hypothetical protein
MAWNDLESGIHYSFSTDDGASFSPPVLLVASTPSAPNAGVANIALFGNKVYIAWSQEPAGVYFSRAVDLEGPFSSPLNISNSPEPSGGPLLRVDPSGTIYLALKQGDAWEPQKILLSQSIDGGLSFSEPLLISGKLTEPRCFDLAVDNGGNLYVTWRNGPLPGDTDTFIAYSTDRGLTFSDPLNISVMGTNSSCPNIVAKEPKKFGLLWEKGSALFYASGRIE